MALTLLGIPLLAFAAVFLLLPRPTPVLRWLGYLVGPAALALASAYLLRGVATAPVVEQFLFYGFSALALYGSFLLVTQLNPARGAMGFVLVVLNTCGLFLIQGAPFLMAGTTIVYAGAIVVTFLFVIMLDKQTTANDADARTREPLLACLAGSLLLSSMLVFLHDQYDTTPYDNVIRRVDAAKAGLIPDAAYFAGLTREVEFQLKNSEPALLRQAEELQAAAAEPGQTFESIRQKLADYRAAVAAARERVGDVVPPEALQQSGFGGRGHLPANNVSALGRLLYSDYIIAIEMAGTLLLVATIGTIAISYRQTEGRRE